MKIYIDIWRGKEETNTWPLLTKYRLPSIEGNILEDERDNTIEMEIYTEIKAFALYMVSSGTEYGP